MRIDALQGLRVKVATVDEWLSGDVRENPIECLEQGASKEQGSGDYHQSRYHSFYCDWNPRINYREYLRECL